MKKQSQLWDGWISTKDQLPSSEMEGEQILMCLDYSEERLVLCGVWKDGEFHCLDTGDVYSNVIEWAYLPKSQKEYDFYYSAKHEAHMRKVMQFYSTSKVNGIVYTEKIEKGKTPVTAKHFDDLVKVFSGVK